MQIKGLDEFSKHLKQLSENAKKLDGTRNVPIAEILTPEFVSANSRFSDVSALFSESGFKIESPEDFTAIPDEEWDRFISTETPFSSWQEMISQAGAIWTKKQLGV